MLTDFISKLLLVGESERNVMARPIYNDLMTRVDVVCTLAGGAMIIGLLLFLYNKTGKPPRHHDY